MDSELEEQEPVEGETRVRRRSGSSRRRSSWRGRRE